jgi:response regulator of citrate/malate metabolism
MPDWRVLIIDDDTRIAGIHARIVSAQAGFRVAGVLSSAAEIAALRRDGVRADLVLLDVFLPGTSGIALLRSLRVHGGPEVIAVTSAREPQIVQDLIHLGVVDYLVKPFTVTRMQEALLRFKDRREAFRGRRALEQAQIDALHARVPPIRLPKSLQQETLDAVRLALSRAGEKFSSAEEIAGTAAVARVTARRYLEYLVSARQAEVLAPHDGPGRPRKLYRLGTRTR